MHHVQTLSLGAAIKRIFRGQLDLYKSLCQSVGLSVCLTLHYTFSTFTYVGGEGNGKINNLFSLFLFSGPDFRFTDVYTYDEYVRLGPQIAMFDQIDGDVVVLNEYPLLVAVYHEGEYSLLVRGGATRNILCKNVRCQFQSKSCAHCDLYKGRISLSLRLSFRTSAFSTTPPVCKEIQTPLRMHKKSNFIHHSPFRW